MKHNMLHMKLKMAVCSAALLAFLPTSAYCGVCFLPDCAESGVLDGTPEIDINSDSKFCEESGFTYYASAKCPQYQAVTAICDRDEHYLKCDAKTWCQKNGYNTTTCSIPQYVNDPCPSYGSLYKGCKTDNAKACKELGYTNTCPSGQKLKKDSGRCSYDSSYGTCCTPSGCPSYTSLTSSSYGTNGTDGCGYACYYTCNMDCPSTHPYSSDPTGCSYRTTNGCGNKSCYQYKACCTPTCINETGCTYGYITINDGCGSTCTQCLSYYASKYDSDIRYLEQYDDSCQNYCASKGMSIPDYRTDYDEVSQARQEFNGPNNDAYIFKNNPEGRTGCCGGTVLKGGRVGSGMGNDSLCYCICKK